MYLYRIAKLVEGGFYIKNRMKTETVTKCFINQC